MKKFTLLLAAAAVVLASLAVPTTAKADGNPAPVCPNGKICKPMGG